MQRSLLTLVLILFSALTAAALWQSGGLLGIPSWHMKSVGGAQVFSDLVIALTLFMVWMWRDAQALGRTAWPWVLVNGLAGPALGVSCFQWALKTTPTGVVLPIVAITPLVIIPFAYRFEGERPSRHSLVGGALAVSGAVALAWVANHPG